MWHIHHLIHRGSKLLLANIWLLVINGWLVHHVVRRKSDTHIVIVVVHLGLNLRILHTLHNNKIDKYNLPFGVSLGSFDLAFKFTSRFASMAEEHLLQQVNHYMI